MRVRNRSLSVSAIACAHLLVACALASCSASERTSSETQELTVCASGDTVEGIDVSHYNGTIDWHAVATAGKVFAFTKATEGTSNTDSKFATNWPAMKSEGLIRGAYHFFRPAQDATAQANHFVTVVGTLGPGDLPPVIDVESTGNKTPSEIIAGVQTWMTIVEAGTGKKPIIYTGKWFWDDYVAASSTFASFGLWDSQYGVSCPDLPSAWSHWIFWQHTDSGSVSGISGAVDLDTFNGNLAALRYYSGLDHDAGTDGGSDAHVDPDGAPEDDGSTRDAPSDARDGSITTDTDAAIETDSGLIDPIATPGDDPGCGCRLVDSRTSRSTHALFALLAFVVAKIRRTRRA